jgi:hypothetical protein
VNGIHVRDSILYFVNLNVFLKMLIHPDGTSAGEPVVINQRKEPTNIMNFDDFTLRGDKTYLATSSGNSILRVDLDGKDDGVIIAGVFADLAGGVFSSTIRFVYYMQQASRQSSRCQPRTSSQRHVLDHILLTTSCTSYMLIQLPRLIDKAADVSSRLYRCPYTVFFSA